MISKSWSPELGERFIVNCYRGCIHACTYCFARQYHEFLGFGAGTDFETKIVAKINAPQVLRAELKRTRKKIPHLEFSFATDPYLPLEAEYQLTRKCLEVCLEFKMPVGVITKSPLVTRDLDLLEKTRATVFFSIPFLTNSGSNPFELYTPVPEVRFRAMRALSEAGIRTGIGIAPIIPGYNDADIPGLLERARQSGATLAFMSLIHFDTDSILDYFIRRLREKLPTKADKIINGLRRERGGNLRHRNFKERNAGTTERWEMAKKIFEVNFRRLGFERFERKKIVIETDRPIQPNLF